MRIPPSNWLCGGDPAGTAAFFQPSDGRICGKKTMCPRRRRRIFSGARTRHAERKSVDSPGFAVCAGKAEAVFSERKRDDAPDHASGFSLADLPSAAETKVFLKKTEEIKLIPVQIFLRLQF